MNPEDSRAKTPAQRHSEPPAGASSSPLEIEIQLRFGDTDALGHINNTAIASYAELGRVELMRRVSWDEGGPILARIAIDFHAQVHLGARVVVTTAVPRIGRSSIALHQEVLADGVVAASVESVVVWFDYQAQRPVAVPEQVRAVLLAAAGAAGTVPE